MIKKYVLIALVAFLFLGFIFLSVDTPVVHQDIDRSMIQETPEIINQMTEDPVPQEQLRLNVLPNPSFEDWDSVNNCPESWYAQTSAHQHGDTAYTEEVANGTYAGYVESMGGDVSYGNTYIFTRPIIEALVQPGISLRFNWNALAVPDLNIGSEVFLYLMIRDGLGNDYYFYYYLSSGSTTHTNTSIYARFMLNDTINQWNNFDRNITEDFIDVFGSGALTSAHYIDYLWFYTSSPSGSTDIARSVFDDVVLYNTTFTDWLTNGDFEMGTGYRWTTYNSSLGYMIQSTDSTLDTYSINVTVPYVTQGSGYARCYRSFSATGTYQAITPGMNIIEIDWKYGDNILAGSNQYAYIRFAYFNGSSEYHVHYYFGHDSDVLTSSNSTGNYHVKMPGFGTRDTWTHSVFDLYEANNQLGLYNVSLIGISIYVYDSATGGTVELLVDNIQMLTYPASDPTFEYENVPSYSAPFLGWHRIYDIPGTVTSTSDSHSGLAACNITTVGQEDGIYRGDIYVDFDSKLATDFWWRLDSMESSSSAAAYIQFEFYNLASFWHIRYVLGRSAIWMPSNSSNYKYIPADGFNQTGTWFNFARNITADFENSFAASSDTWYLSGIELHVFSAPGLKVSCIFDDINFIDTEPPTISTVTQSVNPVYSEVTSVSVTATDIRPGVSVVTLNYTTDDWNSWNVIGTTYGTTTFDADIPAQPYDTHVQYYVVASDGCGVQAIDDNAGLYYSYFVGDDTDPTLTITNPGNNTEQSGLLTITTDVEDPGSGIEYVIFNADGSGAITDYTAPYSQNWNLDDESLGSHLIIVTVRDNAGNEVTKTHYFTVVDTVAPVLDSPADIEFDEGETGYAIDWTPTDIRPTSYEVFVDEASTFVGTWNSTTEHIIVHLDGLTSGEYNYTCVVYDEGGNSAFDMVMVTVNEGFTTTTTTTSPTTTGTATSSEPTGGADLLTPLLLVVAIGVVGVLLIVFVVLPKMKKT
jgi:hypothetical protein